MTAAGQVHSILTIKARRAEAAGVISTDASRATVRVIRTHEELMIARSVLRCGAVTTPG